jgi:hypothetical protein
MTLEQYLDDLSNKSPREKALDDALKQIDQQFGKNSSQNRLLEQHQKNVKAMEDRKKKRQTGELPPGNSPHQHNEVKKPKSTVQKAADWTKILKKQPVRSAAWNNVTAQHHTLGTHITVPYPGSNGLYAFPDDTDYATALSMNDIQEILKRTATTANITAGAQGQNMKVEVTFEGNGLQRFANMCSKGRPGPSGNAKYDLEILKEQVTEVGDDLSADFKKGIEAAVAVLLQGAHLEEFLS